LRYLGCDPSQADDLVQETFLALVEKPPEARGPSAMAGYLRQVALNKFLMLKRQSNSRPAIQELEAAEAVWQGHCGDDGAERYLDALRSCLEKVNERQNQLLRLKYEQCSSVKSIALKLEMSPDGIKTLLRRTREALRNCIEKKLL